MLVQRAASSADPQYVLDGSGGSPLPGSHVTPNNVYLPFAFTHETEQGTVYLQNPLIGRLSHSLIVLLALPLTFLLWRRRGQADIREAMLLLALLFLLRCVLDPMSLDYYHVPFLAALGAAGALGTLREARLSLFAAAGLAIAYAVPTLSMYELSRDAIAKNIVYLVVTLPLLWALGRELYGPERAALTDTARAARAPADAQLARPCAGAAARRCRRAARAAGRDRRAGWRARGPSRPSGRARGARGRPAAAGDPPAVADLADQRLGLEPDAQDAAAAAVADAVGGDLVDGEHEVVGALAREPGALGLRRREVAQLGERVGGDLVVGRVRGRRGQRRGELRDRVVAAKGRAGGASDERMAALGLGDHVRVERSVS